MSKILMIGTGPLPVADSKSTCAAALRTWQMARPLLESPHQLKLLALPASSLPDGVSQQSSLEYEGFFYTQLNAADAVRTIEQTIEDFAPDCLVAVGQSAAYATALARTHLPMWADLPGMSLAGSQLEAAEAHDDAPLEEAWEWELSILSRADKFSAASMPRLHALLGELGLAGRMNHLTADYHFAHHIPDAVHPFFLRIPQGNPTEMLRRERGLADAFLVLWSGSFGHPLDLETLGEALEKAMALNPRIHFVCTGDGTAAESRAPFSRFVAAAEAGPYSSRHHFLNRVEMSRLLQIYRECDFGLCIDGMNYETLLGARARILNMMAVGLPVLTTLGTEISHVVREEEIGLTVSACDPDELADAMVKASRSVQDIHTMGNKARAYVTRSFSATTLCRPLREWVDDAELAPDNEQKARLAEAHTLLQSISLNSIQSRLQLLPQSRQQFPADGAAKRLFRGFSEKTMRLMRGK